MTEKSASEETQLDGGGRTDVKRRGGIVARQTGSWAAAVHALLRHLAIVGFEGSPRIIEPEFDSQGRELLTFIEGEIVHPNPWTDEALAALGRMLRQLHNATAAFRVPANALWQSWFIREVGQANVIGHC